MLASFLSTRAKTKSTLKGAFCFGSATAQANPLRKRSAAESGSHIRPKSVGDADPYNFSNLLRSVLNCAIIKSEGGADVKKILIVIAFIMAYAGFLSL